MGVVQKSGEIDETGNVEVDISNLIPDEVDLEPYALKTDLPDLAPYAKTAEVDEKLAECVKLSDLEDGVTFDTLSASSITVDGKQVSLEGHGHDVKDIKGIEGVYAKLEDIPDVPDYKAMESVLWADLRQMKEEHQLVPGRWYRITDYETKTGGWAAADAMSDRGNLTTERGLSSTAAEVGLEPLPFDVIVLATSDGSLSERAFAAPRADHAYSRPVKFQSWRLLYSLDNDENRFYWIRDAEDAKGVVYGMVDENGNSCSYDFKNIVFLAKDVGTSAPEDLIHRWSFNDIAEDGGVGLSDTGSIGGMTAALYGNAELVGSRSVRIHAGDPDSSYVELGANPIPSELGDTPFTIEVWATPTSLQSYASVFSLGERGSDGDPSSKGLMGVFEGYRQVKRDGEEDWGPCMQPLCGTIPDYGTHVNVSMTQGSLSAGTPYYFAYVVTPSADGTNSAKMIGYVYDATTYGLVGKSDEILVQDWTTSQFNQSWFALGTTCWGNRSPGADYDEVRVWKKALTQEEIEWNVKAGPDSFPDDWQFTFSGVYDGMKVDRSLYETTSQNVIRPCIDWNGVISLNRVVLTNNSSGQTIIGNTIEANCGSIFASGNIVCNRIGERCGLLRFGRDV